MRRPAASLGLALCSLLLACGKRDEPAAAGAEARGDAAPITEDPPPTPPPAPPRTLVEAQPPPALPLVPVTGPGPAYLAVDNLDGGLIKLDEQGFQRVASDSSLSISQFALARDGTLWAGGVTGLYRIADTGAQAVDMTGAPDGLRAMAVDPAGRVWVVGYEQIGRYESQGGAQGWVTLPLADIDATIEHASALAADANGRILLGSMHALHVWDGATWHAHDFGPSDQEPMLGTLRASVDGSRIVLGNHGGTLERVGDEWRRIDWTLPLADDELLALGPDGSIVQASIDGKLAIKSGSETELLQLAELGFTGTDIRALFVDEAKRVWLSTDAGLTIIDAARKLVSYPPSSVPEFDGRIESLFVLGAGPTTLPSTGPMRTGTVTGTLIVGGTPVAHANVELCPSAKLLYRGASPCDGAPVHMKATTDDDGRFRFEHVPVADLSFVFRLGDTWKMGLGPTCCRKLEAGGALDLGDVTFDAPSE